MTKFKTFLALYMCMIFLIGCNSSNDHSEDSSPSEEINKKEISGTWSGAIEVPNQTLNILVAFQKDDSWEVTLSIPVQNVQNYPFSTVNINDSKVYLSTTIGGQEISFNGERKKEKIEGTFTQAGQSFSFYLTKGGQSNEEKEKGDFLTLETSAGKLYGELELPNEKGQHPVVLIIPGSGPTDRNGNSAGAPGENNSLKMLAEELAKQGMASVRYDKRGVGKNTEAIISESKLRFDRFVMDAEKWIEKLKTDERFSNVGVIGHSQGSLVGMMAAQNQKIDAFVSLAGAGNSIDKVLKEQLSSLPDSLKKEAQSILNQLKQGETVKEVPSQLQSLFRESVQPFLVSWIKHDPTEEIKQLNAPTLIVNGKNDIQVSVKEAEMLHNAKTESQLLIIDGMNHVLKDAPENREENAKTYTNPDLPLADSLVDGIMSFFKKVGFVESR
ncbi:S9 family peptidase [Pontibacillus sp. HMF3514]|uniref:alpha/beta hydrolase family protein n=1 Tax=Pontibacillus sp. HMF3514 TaxID=2692425 RepID=UPI00131FB583|nr:alpha/beta fold hydrolase [Pontibacillus sp. HMF3514]QHE51848.1 alpha/beta fold hydrolase [Pontibacillus sp. HMF3514]